MRFEIKTMRLLAKRIRSDLYEADRLEYRERTKNLENGDLHVHLSRAVWKPRSRSDQAHDSGEIGS